MSLFSANFKLILFGKAGYLLLFAILLAAFTIFIYRRTNPIVSNRIRFLLISLRILALFILLLVLFESTARWMRTVKKPPLLAVAIDTSASIGLRDAYGDRPVQIKNLLYRQLGTLLDNDLQIKYFRFAENAREISRRGLDSLTYDGDATDIASSLETIKGQLQDANLAGVLLVTDGNYTQGGNPIRYAAGSDVPLHVLGVGAAGGQPDLSITRVEANAIAFTGESTPVQVALHTQGITQTHARVVLRDESGEVAGVTVPIRTAPFDSTLTFSYVAKKVGRQKLVARVQPQSGELSAENNKKTIYVDVLKSRLQVLILAGAISADVSFLRNHLKDSDRFELCVLVQGVRGDFTGDRRPQAVLDSLDQYDLLMWQNFPTARTTRPVLSQLQESLARRPRPMVLLAGDQTDWAALSPFASLLPMPAQVYDGGEMQVLPVVSAAGRSHALMQVPGRDLTAWNLLPPVFMRHQLRTTWPDAEILAHARPAYGSSAATLPLILTRSSGQKSIAIMGYELWRWHLMMAGIGNDDDVYHHFVNHLVRWLQIERNTELIRLQLDKMVYHYGETINVDAYAFNAQLKPIDGALARIVLKNGDKQEETDLAPAGNGKYSAALRPDLAGDYTLSMTVWLNNEEIGKAETQFTVGEYNQELAELALQSSLLRGLAETSGGHFAPIDSAAGILQGITGKTKFEVLNRDIELWNRAFTLTAIILLLTLEWFLRKRKGMV